MPFFFVVTNTQGAFVVEASKAVLSPAEVVFYAEGKPRQAFPRRDVLVYEQCGSSEEAKALLADYNGEGL